MKYLVLSALFFTSFSSFAEPTRIIGEDTRVRITNKNATTIHDSIGMLVMRFGDRQGSCTGTVVSARHVITAAHCLYNHSTGKFAEKVVFIPGLRDKYSPSKSPFGTFEGSKMRVLAQYIKSRSNSDDLGLVTFEENLPVSALSMRLPNKNDKRIVIAGYPGDKTAGELWEGRGDRFSHFFESNPDSYTVDTYAGQSGSTIRAASLKDSEIIGVHSGARENIFYDYNVGFFFKKATLDAVKKWISDDK